MGLAILIVGLSFTPTISIIGKFLCDRRVTSARRPDLPRPWAGPTVVATAGGGVSWGGSGRVRWRACNTMR
jgi:hypothetical protein